MGNINPLKVLNCIILRILASTITAVFTKLIEDLKVI
jgi:hypothetical protein